jgi:hypothetical protein
MSKTVKLSLGRIMEMEQVLSRFIDGYTEMGPGGKEIRIPPPLIGNVPLKVRYRLGVNRDHLQSKARLFQAHQKNMVEKYGESIAVRKEKIAEFLAFIFSSGDPLRKEFEEMCCKKYAALGETFGLVESILGEVKKDVKDQSLIEKWFKRNPASAQKEVVMQGNFGLFNIALNEIKEEEETIEFRTIPLNMVENLSADPHFGVLISQIPDMWEGDEESLEEKAAKEETTS